MHASEPMSLACANRHSFDLSKDGYVNFLNQPVHMQYGKEMFASRRIISGCGFYDPLIHRISEIIGGAFKKDNTVRILDAGCGEGSHTAILSENLVAQYHDVLTAGIDISKEAIKMAAKKNRNMVWCVADLTNIPFMDKKFDVVLNILSPSNYGEFERIMADGGLLIKVIPGNGYLAQLRELFYTGTGKETYSNEKVANHFKESFHLSRTEEIRYTAALSKENLRHLIKMTPLSWGVSDEAAAKAAQAGAAGITVDLTLLIGKKPEKSC